MDRRRRLGADMADAVNVADVERAARSGPQPSPCRSEGAGGVEPQHVLDERSLADVQATRREVVIVSPVSCTSRQQSNQTSSCSRRCSSTV